MGMPQHHFYKYLQQQQQQQQQQEQQQKQQQQQQQQQQQHLHQYKPFRGFYNLEGQISPPVTHFDSTNLSDHPPYIPQFHVAGFAPGPGSAMEGSDGGGLDLQCNYNLEPKKEIPQEQDFLENNNSQISSVDFLQPRSVSTGLGLSLDNGRLASSGDSASVILIGDDIDRDLQRQDVEIDRFIKLQSDRLRKVVLEKVQANQLRAISYVEDKFAQKLREKEVEVDHMNKKNMDLEMQMEQVAMEASAWQQRAKYSENMINTLKLNLQQVYAQSRGSNKEGCGDSEVDDAASCCNGRANDFHILCKGNNDMKELMICKVCRMNEVCILLLPCKHLCLCKECESKVSVCPLCQSCRYLAMEVYM